MKLIIAGKRTICPQTQFIDGIIDHFNIWVEEIVSGEAKGVDTAAKYYCESYYGEDASEKYKEFPADWDKYGNAAGPIRNRQMANYADALLIIWDGVSRGSSNMKQEMLSLKKPVYEVILKSYNIEEEEI